MTELTVGDTIEYKGHKAFVHSKYRFKSDQPYRYSILVEDKTTFAGWYVFAGDIGYTTGLRTCE